MSMCVLLVCVVCVFASVCVCVHACVIVCTDYVSASVYVCGGYLRVYECGCM